MRLSKFNFETTDFQYIIYKYLDDVIDCRFPVSDVSISHCTLTTSVHPNSESFLLKVNVTSAIFKLIRWYQIDDSTIGCFRIKFKHAETRQDDISKILCRDGDLAKFLLDKFEIVLLYNFSTEPIYINNELSQIPLTDIIALRVDDIKYLLNLV